ncbi:probable ubiquitin carboxyl-terminal hydrolase MINDY-4 isoform X1 [Chiloscyllium plagiosum]|uniref:probable ubiquitin carboxyl-terminal hydrolase MINDY-4 isoform X1 n=1 Tax=Chiloscyllium plagiosum TaxID=36176 RepID=UPI001CB7C4C4|nr:probable ubiquitin carboxyl-terminal hydrolase MINDY-4 isoform X1 [Chiloscyllium plagiosum]
MDNTNVEETAAALVREYLSRKGLKKTISALDQELPRTEGSINTRNELKKVLHLESLYKQNKAQLMPLKTMLEIITKYFLDSNENTKIMARDNFRTPAIVNQRATSVRFDSTFVNIYDLSDEDKGGGIAFHDLNKSEACRFPNDSAGLACMSVPSSKPLQSSLKKKDRSPGRNGCPSGGEPGLLPVNILSSDAPRAGVFPVEARGTNMESQRPRSGRIVRGMMSGPIRTVQEDSSKKRLIKRASGSSLTLHSIESDVDSGFKGYIRQVGTSCETAACSDWLPAAGTLMVDNMADGTPTQDYPPKKPSCLVTGGRSSQKSQDFRWYHEAADDPGTERVLDRERGQVSSGQEKKLSSNFNVSLPEKSRKVKFAPDCMNIEYEARENDVKMEEDLHSRKPTMCSPENQLIERLQIADIDDDDLEEVDEIAPVSSLRKHHIDSKPIDLSLAIQVKNLLFGSSFSCFAEEWKIQSFTFSDVPDLRYGIVQKKGGPCGVLAAIQACVLQKLIFEDIANSGSEAMELQPTNGQRSQCLALAIADILWRAGDRRRAVVALSTGRQQFIPAGKYKADGTIETIILNTLTNFQDLTTFLQQNVGQFEIGPFGCILLTLSAILSRSIDLVKSDFDVPSTTLIGAHGYCTQELVNLLLTGKAVSNVFNDVVELDSGNGNITVLKGISGRSDIGLLSLFEHYSICKVGSFLKTPKFPIWVVCSESHFSVLFCLKKELMSDWKFERRFDLFYYDGLANQQEEIRLTIDASEHCSLEGDDDLIPPLEHCIRTKWKGAFVDWNGTDPIL